MSDKIKEGIEQADQIISEAYEKLRDIYIIEGRIQQLLRDTKWKLSLCSDLIEEIKKETR